MRKNTFKKKIGIYRVLLGHPSFGLTRRVKRFSLNQLQAGVLNEINLVKASGLELTRQVGPGLITILKRSNNIQTFNKMTVYMTKFLCKWLNNINITLNEHSCNLINIFFR